MAAPLKSVDISTLSKATPYIQRIVQDAKLRENVRTAYDSSRSAYARLTNGKAPAKALMEDKRLQRDLQHAVEALREATTALTEAREEARPEAVRIHSQAHDRGPWVRARAGGQREAAHQGAGHGVRQGGGVRVHAASGRRLDAAELTGRIRLARRDFTPIHVNGGAGRRLRRVKGMFRGCFGGSRGRQ